MAKRNTYGYRAELARKKAKTTIAAYQRVARNESLPKQTRDFAKYQIQTIRSLQAATRQRTKSGKPIPNRSQGFLDAAMKDLNEANAQGEYYKGSSGKVNIFTQHEIAKGSVGQSGEFTKAEVQIFYRATRAAWDRKGIDYEERNQAILEYYGFKNLREAIRTVLGDNPDAIKASEMETYKTEKMTPEQAERYANETDEGDEEPSPSYLSIVRPAEPQHTNIVSPERQ